MRLHSCSEVGLDCCDNKLILIYFGALSSEIQKERPPCEVARSNQGGMSSKGIVYTQKKLTGET